MEKEIKESILNSLKDFNSLVRELASLARKTSEYLDLKIRDEKAIKTGRYP